jgi:hypothetical protein
MKAPKRLFNAPSLVPGLIVKTLKLRLKSLKKPKTLKNKNLIHQKKRLTSITTLIMLTSLTSLIDPI